MTVNCLYRTPAEFDDLLLSFDEGILTGVHFLPAEQTGEASGTPDVCIPALRQTTDWLDRYFSGKVPGELPPFRLPQSTAFRQAVTERLLRIPYGKTVTYGALAADLAAERGIPRMSAQAVGGAVGANPLCILIPCHRVIGANGRPVGYGGGIRNKIALLRLEGIAPGED